MLLIFFEVGGVLHGKISLQCCQEAGSLGGDEVTGLHCPEQVKVVVGGMAVTRREESFSKSCPFLLILPPRFCASMEWPSKPLLDVQLDFPSLQDQEPDSLPLYTCSHFQGFCSKKGGKPTPFHLATDRVDVVFSLSPFYLCG